jgi:hypothetical protein
MLCPCSYEQLLVVALATPNFHAASAFGDERINVVA